MATCQSLSESRDDSASSSSGVSSIQTIKDAVDRLYAFRDHYFENHEVAKAAEKLGDVAKEMQKTVTMINTLKSECEKEDRALFNLHLGRALNVLPHFDQGAYDALSKAVKLDFKLVDAWNQLGECNWKKGDMQGAKTCFEGALQRGPNKISLRNLSIVRRQLGKTRDEEQSNVLESITKAKDSVSLDVNDGMSWVILGNAYLTSFFTLGQDPKLLKQCLSAYQQADKDPVSSNNPDLHYNRSVAFKYEEEYQLALEGFEKALALDPTWSQPRQKKEHLMSYLQKVEKFISNKGQVSPKKLKEFVASLVAKKDMGPYDGSSKFRGKEGQTISLKHSTLNALHPAVNLETVILGKVVCTVTSDDPVPFTFCMIDEESTCISVTVYNLAQGDGVIIGDSVAIPEPFVQDVQVKYENLMVNYRSIRVDSPIILVVNGKKVGVGKHAPTKIGITPLS